MRLFLLFAQFLYKNTRIIAFVGAAHYVNEYLHIRLISELLYPIITMESKKEM
jgi:hypothetical protein